MITLADLITLGDTAAAADQPLISNWIQIRAGIYMFGRAAGGPDQVEIATFGDRFPSRFEDLPPDLCDLMPGAGPYGWSRTAILRLLAMLGHSDDPWEALRMMIREAGRHDIEYHWGGLKTPAVEAGLAPSDIRADWVWGLDAEQGLLTEEQLQRRKEREARRGIPNAKLAASRRMRLRRAVVLFDELHDIPAIAASGLLPPEPIGAPPRYNVQGRTYVDLPPTLARYQAALANPDGDGLPQVWRAMCASEWFDPKDDPSADDLLRPSIWAIIKSIPLSVTGYAGTTWHQYTTKARAALLPHATRPIPEHLPASYEAMIASKADRAAMQALWRLLCERGGAIMSASPDELIDLATWRDLWGTVPDGVTPATWRTYRSTARTILVRHTASQVDPFRAPIRAWANLRRGQAALAPIRQRAEDAKLRPIDITPEWLARQDLSAEQHAEIHAALREIYCAAAQTRYTGRAVDPADMAWQTLRTALQAQGLTTRELCRVATPATNDGLGPADLTPAWATATAAQMDHRTRAKFAIQLRNLDGLLGNPKLAPLIYAAPIGPLRDGRKHGKIEPPEAIMREMDAVTAAHGRAKSTCREALSLVRKVWTAAVQDQVKMETAAAKGGTKFETLEDLLAAAPILTIPQRHRRLAARYLRDLRACQA
ncbi:hypothetical protein [Limimaricola litoreus]|uniref:Uncharacterized protein n=1 Tax=Limimaricola litoreus TaxID=2955316 RepID=A0A9X2JNI8_9RHOB|nr:hypothetical protein [Limimaricola litoreus]MCP1168897.1 hypothetical protein [Limimaricola litoreus]